MGTTQLLFVLLTFVLFGYFVVVSNQRTEMMLIQDARDQLFDDMMMIGDLANEYYLTNTSTEPDVLQTLYLPWSDGGMVTTMVFQTGENYLIKISGVITIGSEVHDPVYYTTNNWVSQTKDANLCNYSPFYLGDLTYNAAHVYEFIFAGTGTTKIFKSNGCIATLPDNIFTIEISRAGTSVDAYNTYDGFVPPQYLLNRPYTDIVIQNVSDSVIQFTGSSTLEPGVVHERICTPSGSLQLIP